MVKVSIILDHNKNSYSTKVLPFREIYFFNSELILHTSCKDNVIKQWQKFSIKNSRLKLGQGFWKYKNNKKIKHGIAFNERTTYKKCVPVRY